jgi:regulator of RNase E activity RraA
VPIFAQFINQAMTQGRVEYQAHNVPITVGGVRVDPGDVVVADGDGVIVVPQERAEDVAKYARQEWTKDRALRRRIYDGLGWAPDDTVAAD